MPIYVAGLDLGQQKDYSALVILEAFGRKLKNLDNEQELIELPFSRLNLRHIERFPLGTKYAEIARLVDDRMSRTPEPRFLAVDVTGVGLGVIEMIPTRLNAAQISITGGDQVHYGDGALQYRVPKRDLVAGLSIALQNEVLKIAAGLPHAQLLTNELANFRVKITAAANDTYAAWREADHDDLVLAAGLAAWYADFVFRSFQQCAAEQAFIERLHSRVSISRY